MSTKKFAEPARSRAVSRSWLHACAVLATVPLFASCDDNNWCGNCGYVPTSPSETSYGLVAGNFTLNGHASVIATSTVYYYPPGQSGESQDLPLDRGGHIRGACAHTGRR